MRGARATAFWAWIGILSCPCYAVSISVTIFISTSRLRETRYGNNIVPEDDLVGLLVCWLKLVYARDLIGAPLTIPYRLPALTRSFPLPKPFVTMKDYRHSLGDSRSPRRFG